MSSFENTLYFKILFYAFLTTLVGSVILAILSGAIALIYIMWQWITV